MGKINCMDNTFHPDSYVCSKEFECVLSEQDPCSMLHSQELVDLFGRCFIFDEAFLNDLNLLLQFAKYIFYSTFIWHYSSLLKNIAFYCRMLYSRIELAAKGNQVHNPGTPLKVMRQQLNEFLTYLKVYIYR